MSVILSGRRHVKTTAPMPLASDSARIAKEKFEASELSSREPISPIVFERLPQKSVIVRAMIANGTSLSFRPEEKIMRRELCAAFGGFTSYSGEGGWINPKTGKADVENVLIAEVSFAKGNDAYAKLQIARDIFFRFGRAIGEEWVRVEVHEIETHCAQVNGAPPAPGSKDDEDFAVARRARLNGAH